VLLVNICIFLETSKILKNRPRIKKIYPSTRVLSFELIKQTVPILPGRQAKHLAHLTLRATDYSILCSTHRPTNLLLSSKLPLVSKPV
jgi:hypothetical protein